MHESEIDNYDMDFAMFPRHQEAWNYSTPKLGPEDLDRLLLADWDVQREQPYLFSRTECWAAIRNLPFLRPSVFWVFGGRSFFSPGEAQDTKIRESGVGVGGNGGVDKGMVEKAVLSEGGHNVVCV
ncbi:hypothetical protein EYZ11_000856 [Aspergillus tanneri]|uniref:Uncharacterized protein n=1 Tax=Aspergillus tanneri TaxID=1220188 RepID=A0A4S3JW74_9EURO|nr:uncharacterized protein ATNIH1004_003141 [Aspergillus tanneri]KAA8650455.1 hypothetical protein ATNIH1004_003141 [Aspergillus tanneri]THC99695.1 hypothetical protein EYZ11_000856 [Aspergillus tanneri]